MEKNWKKRWMAGAMAFALCCTTLLQTGASAVSAAEVGGVSAQSETQIEVQTETQTETQTEKSEEELIEETVADPELALMVTEGEAFDIQNDFTGLKLSDGDHVELKKAAMEDGTVFDYNHAGTYKCVYLVTPASGEAYLVARNITVTPREAETDGSNGGQEQETGDDEPEADPVLPTISPEDAPETLEEPEETEEPEEEEAEEFSDEETEDGSHQVDIVQGNEFNIELDHEDGRYQTGETVNFSGDIPQGSLIAVGTSLVEANQTENTEDLLYAEVSYDEGTNSFSFEMPEDDVALSVLYDQAEGGISTMAASDGDLWDDSTDIEANTYYYYSDGKLHPFDSVMGQGGNDSYKYIRYKAGRKTYTVYAYCMQHSKQSPPSGTTYKNMVELDEGGDDRYLRKAMFYGYGGPGWGGTFNGYNIKSIMEKYGCSSETRAMQHYLVDYLYDGESGFGGSLSTTAKNMLKEIKAALAKMPDPTTMELTPGLSASANGNQSPTFTWKANAAFVITIHLENGVSLVNETTGKTGTGNVSVKGGEKFHLEATTQNIGSLKGKYAITSNYPLNFHAMLLKLANSQDIGFGYYTDTLELNLEVDWPDEATVKIIKKDKGSNALLAGAVYGIYADEACTKLIKKMPARNGKDQETEGHEYGRTAELQKFLQQLCENLPKCVRESGGFEDKQNECGIPASETEASSDNALQKILYEMAKETLDEKIQKEIFEHLQKELMEIPFEEGHDLVQKKLCRKTEISDFLKLLTEKYEGQLKQVKKRLRLKLLPILKNQKERTEHKLFLGRRVDLRNIAAPSGAVFKKQQPGKKLDICVAVLVDNSFSMCGERMDHAILAALCLYDFCMESEIPVLVCGHHTDGYRHENLKDETVYLHCCADFETDEKDRFRIAGMQPYGSNRDGTALWYAGSRLLERPEKQKLLFVISDGAPNANQYGGTGAKRDLQKIRKKLLQQGVFFQAAAIGSDKEAIQEIYEESFLDITDLEQLPALLTKKLLRFIRR